MEKQAPGKHDRTGATLAEWVQMFPDRAGRPPTQDGARPGAGGVDSYTRVDGCRGRHFTSIDESLLLCGDAGQLLALLPEDSVQTVITSPPYWSLRDYDTEGQIGRDDSLSEYVDSIVGAFEALKRVLRSDGTVWLNVGDAFTSGNRRYRAPDRKNRARAMSVRPPTPDGLKPKDLIGLPWRLAFALQDAGWWVRSEVIWNKPNAHPESVRDRPTKAHETLFLLSKSQNYHYDIQAVQGPNGRRVRSVWDIPTEPRQCLNGHAGDHPAPMPLSLARRCVSLTSSENGVVLDPYAGSGTTLLAARELGRKWVGIELNPAFVDLIEHRMRADEPGSRYSSEPPLPISASPYSPHGPRSTVVRCIRTVRDSQDQGE